MSISAVGGSSANTYQVTRSQQAQAGQNSAPVDADGDHDGDTAPAAGAAEPGKGAAVDVSA